MMVIDLLICIAIAAATIAMLFFQTFSYRHFARLSSHDSAQTLQRILDATSQLSTLPPERRGPLRRAIARDILLNIEFIYTLVSECYRSGASENPEARDLAFVVSTEIIKLAWELRKSLFLFHFHSKAVAGCERIFHALDHHCRVLDAYIEFLKAQYPYLRENPMDDAP